MSIDYSKFGKLADSVEQKVNAALKDDNKISENEIKQMKLSKEIEQSLRQELASNPGIYEDAFVVTKQDNNGKYTLRLDRLKNEGSLTLTKDSMEYFKKNYPEAEISGAYYKNGVVYLENKFGEQAIDKNGNPIRYSFRQDSQNSNIDLISYYLEHNNGEFDLAKFNTWRMIQDKINLAPDVAESYTSLMQSIEFDNADDEGKTRMLFEQAKKNCSHSQSIGELMSNMFTCLMLNCQVKDYELKIPEIRRHFNEFFQLDKIASAARDFVNDGDDSHLSAMENIVSETIGFVKGAENFMTSTQLLAFAGIMKVAELSSAVIGLGEVFAIATTGFFGYEAGTMGVNAILDGIDAKTPEEAESYGEQLGAVAMMMLGVRKGAKKISENIKHNHLSEFGQIKAAIENAASRDDLTGIGLRLKEIDITPQERLELNKTFFKKTLEIQSNYSTIQKGILNMHKGEITPKVAERNKAIKTILENIKEGETITLNEIAEKLHVSISDVRNSIYNPNFGLKELFEKVNARSTKAKTLEQETAALTELSPELQEIAKKQPDVVEMLVNIKKADGTQFHSVEDIKILADESTRMPGFVKTLATQINNDGEPRFTAEQIRSIIHLYYKEPVIAKQLVYTKDSKNENYKYTVECVQTVAETFENGTTAKKAMARKLLHNNPTAYPNKEVPEYPSDIIIAELSKVVKRGRPPKSATETPLTEMIEQTGTSTDVQSEPGTKPVSTAILTDKYEFKRPYYKTSASDLKREAEGTSEKLFSTGQKTLFNFIKKFEPGSSTPNPIVITVGNNHFGFTVKKTAENKTIVTVKNWLGDKASWDKAAYVEKSLSFELDKNGQMSEGCLSWNDYYESAYKSEYSYSFNRNANGKGIIRYNEASYGDKAEFKTNIEPLEIKTEVYEQSTGNTDLWYDKYEFDRIRNGRRDFDVQEGSLDMLPETFSYTPDGADIFNLFLQLAKPETSSRLIKPAEQTKPTVSMSNSTEEIVQEVPAQKEAEIKQTDEKPQPKESVKTRKKKYKKVFQQNKTKETKPTEQDNGLNVDVSKLSFSEQMEYRENVYTRLYNMLLKKLPAYMKRAQKNGKMENPLVIDINGYKIGFIIDRTNESENKISVKIKQWNGGKKFDDTIGRNESGETLSLTLNADGQMTGAIFNVTSQGQGKTTTFTRNKKGQRRFVVNGIHFQPVANTKRHWVTISGKNIGETRATFSESGMLMDVLLELAELDTAIEL